VSVCTLRSAKHRFRMLQLFYHYRTLRLLQVAKVMEVDPVQTQRQIQVDQAATAVQIPIQTQIEADLLVSLTTWALRPPHTCFCHFLSDLLLFWSIIAFLSLFD